LIWLFPFIFFGNPIYPRFDLSKEIILLFFNYRGENK
jgi:hypothetical protein